MSDPTEPGWYLQDDGSRRYWDGESWTGTETVERTTPRYERIGGGLPKIRLAGNVMFAGLAALVGILMLAGGAIVPGICCVGGAAVWLAVEYV